MPFTRQFYAGSSAVGEKNHSLARALLILSSARVGGKVQPDRGENADFGQISVANGLDPRYVHGGVSVQQGWTPAATCTCSQGAAAKP